MKYKRLYSTMHIWKKTTPLLHRVKLSQILRTAIVALVVYTLAHNTIALKNVAELSATEYANGTITNQASSETEYILWPRPISINELSCVPPCNRFFPHALLPPLELLPPNLAPKKKPSCDAIIRSFHGHSLLLNTLLRSMEIFWPHGLGKIIVILDDSEVDRSFAVTLPDYVTVFFEQMPPFTDMWTSESLSHSGSVPMPKPGHSRGMWSNLISDRYTSADFIALFDSDQVLSSGGQLQLLFDWDIGLQRYKPIFVCLDHRDLFDEFFGYQMFGMTDQLAIGCMSALPVVMHRSTFPKIREYMINYFLMKMPSIYHDWRLSNVSIDYDRDSHWSWHEPSSIRHKTGSITPTYFDRAFIAAAQQGTVCQFCIFGAFIYTHPEESSRYSFRIIGYEKSAKRLEKQQIKLIKYAKMVDDYRLTKSEVQKKHIHGYPIYRPECTQIHSGAHIAYLVEAKGTEAYFLSAEQIIDDGLCKLSRPDDCNHNYCRSRGWNYDALKQREQYARKKRNLTFPSQFYSNQQAMLGWERNIRAPGGAASCENLNYAMLHNYFEWMQVFETKLYDHFKLRQCKEQDM